MLICKNEFLDGGLFKGGFFEGGGGLFQSLVSSSMVDIKTTYKEITNIIIFIIKKVAVLLFGLQSKEIIRYSYFPVGAFLNKISFCNYDSFEGLIRVGGLI